MSEDTALRFRLVERMWKMRYGDSFELDAHIAHQAWPPTGDEDRSDVGAFRAMALSFGGNRPEESLTTEARINRDLEEGGFAPVVLHLTGDKWLVHRRLTSCPKCRGSGYISERQESSMLVGPADVSMTDVVIVTRTKCDHRPE